MPTRLILIHFPVLLAVSLTACGSDDRVVSAEDELEKLYRELTGTYDLFRVEVTPAGEAEALVLEPPEVKGTMTIHSDQRLSQSVELEGITSATLRGTFEIRLDEEIMLVDNEDVDLISKISYTWDGTVLTTTLDAGTFVEKDFWRKQ